MRSVFITLLASAERLKVLVKLIVALVAMQLLVAVLHEGLVLGVATTLQSTDIRAVNAQIEQLPLGLDAVHTQLALSVITAVRPRGVAVAGLPGEWLHSAFPSIFLNPTLVAPGVWISAVLSRGSSLPGLYATRAIVEILLIALGSIIVRAALLSNGSAYLKLPRFNLSGLLISGLYLQAQGLWAILRMTPAIPELEYMGVGFLARNVLGDGHAQYQGLMYQALPPTVTVLLVALGFGILPSIVWLYKAGKRIGVAAISRTATIASVEQNVTCSNSARNKQLLIGFAVMFVLAGIMPRNLCAETSVRFSQQKRFTKNSASSDSEASSPAAGVAAILATAPVQTPAPLATDVRTRAVTVPTPTSAPTPQPIRIERSTSGASIVRIHWSPALAHFVLTNKDGELFTIRAINYNTHYTQLPADEHRRILERDFKRMHQAGVNVITGFATFDETTLKVAEEYGIYVIMPFIPDLNGDYLDAGYRNYVKQELAVFIKRFENYGSLLMWNYDDEPLHNLVERIRRPPDQAKAFSDFLLELAEHAYRTDRYHRPSWIKEPREWYLDLSENSITEARKRASAQGTSSPDPFRYAILARSAYGAPVDIQDWLPRLATKVEGDLKMPFAIGEYGVLGIDPKERAYHLVEIWKEASHDSRIGSAVYTYGPFQPHPNDLTDPAIAAQMQLVDINGEPIDDAWAKLSEVWLAQQADERDHRSRTSILLAAPQFKKLFEELGGYPSSGPIQEGTLIKQFFVEGKRSGHPIAYLLSWNASIQQVEFVQVDQVVFNELGDHTLGGMLLQTYMTNGGYARFGAPISNLQPQGDEGRRVVQEFAKGGVLIQESVSSKPSP